jgi:MmyB-like transcription regulator ligand binding domain
MLRLEAGRNPHDKALITLVGELSTQSELFRQHWASHNVSARFEPTQAEPVGAFLVTGFGLEPGC